MSVELILLFVVFAGLLLSTAPIAVVLGLTALLYFYYFTTIPLAQLPRNLFHSLESFSLMAVPLFILAANIMTKGGLSKRMTDAVQAVVGRLPGGLAVTSVVACMFFAAISGSSVATVVAIGSVLIPAMVAAGYGRDLPTGIIATSGSMGILIPPSIPLIVYGVVTESSISDLFRAGLVPGVVVGLSLAILVVLIAWRRGLRAADVGTVRDRLVALRRAVPGFLLPVLILGGIYGGVFTPTEAAGIAVVYALIVAMVQRELRLGEIPGILVSSGRMAAMVMFIVANGYLFSFFLSNERIPHQVAAALTALDLEPWAFLLMVNLILLVVGCCMETSSAIVILAPIFIPIATALGINPIHFGIVMVMNLEVGLLTPPVGLNLFVASGISGLPVTRVARAALPSTGLLLAAVLLVTYVPALALWLVE
ncbi:TRAP transporter large permease [Pseudonocardia sp. DLS-67]